MSVQMGSIPVLERRNNCRGLPLSQFYHISVDNAVPYNIYGGLQDNGRGRSFKLQGVSMLRLDVLVKVTDLVLKHLQRHYLFRMQGAENVWRSDMKTSVLKRYTS